jgi:hypothetical protein
MDTIPSAVQVEMIKYVIFLGIFIVGVCSMLYDHYTNKPK